MTENQVSLTELATDFIHHVNVEKGLAVSETTLAKVWQQVTGA